MKTKSVWSKLGKFRNFQTKKGSFIFQSRSAENADRFVEVIEQGENAVCLPIVIESDGTERVDYHPGTIKGLVEFLENTKELKKVL